jgi:hypothetical protein
MWSVSVFHGRKEQKKLTKSFVADFKG